MNRSSIFNSTILIFLSVLLLQGCSAHNFFYMPNRVLYVDPLKAGLDYEMVDYPSLNGKKLYAIVFRTQGKPKGTAVHFHGNYANVSNHFPAAVFLLKQGFDVICFDYQGYGGSEGKPTPRNTVEDGVATVRYAQKDLRDKNTGVVIFAQSLGAAVASVVAVKEPGIVKAVVLESGFTSYRTMARAVLKRSVFLWPLYPVYPWFLGTTYDPVKWVGKIAPRPVFIIHGDKDSIVPVTMAQPLFEKANEPKRLWIIPGANHLECRRIGGKEYEDEIGKFFTDALSNKG